MLEVNSMLQVASFNVGSVHSHSHRVAEQFAAVFALHLRNVRRRTHWWDKKVVVSCTHAPRTTRQPSVHPVIQATTSRGPRTAVVAQRLRQEVEHVLRASEANFSSLLVLQGGTVASISDTAVNLRCVSSPTHSTHASLSLPRPHVHSRTFARSPAARPPSTASS